MRNKLAKEIKKLWIDSNNERTTIQHKKVIVYGVTALVKKIISDGIIDSSNIICFVDADEKKVGEKVYNVSTHSIKEARKLLTDGVVVITTLVHLAEEIKSALCWDEVICYIDDRVEEDIEEFKTAWSKAVTDVQYKYIHVLPSSVFVRNVVALIENEYVIKEHLFVLWVDDPYEMEDYGIREFLDQDRANMVLIPEIYYRYYLCRENKTIINKEELVKLFLGCKKIIFHSAVWEAWLTGFLTEIINDIKIKSVFIAMGAEMALPKTDIRIEKILSMIPKGFIGKTNVGLLKELTSNKMSVVGTLGSIYAYMPSKPENDGGRDIKDDGEIKILLGHSAYGVNHFEGIDAVKKMNVGKYKVYCPLTYGSYETIDKVIAYGKGQLGDDFIPITKTIKLEDYIEFVSKMDIAVMPMESIASAKTTIRYLNIFGIKTFVSQNYYDRNHLDFDIEPISELSKYNGEVHVNDNKSCNERLKNNNMKAKELMDNILGE